jgi:hypothetical protein
VVSEHGEDRLLERRAGRGQCSGLLGLAGRRQIAGEQDQVDAFRDPGERLGDAVAVRLVAVDVAGGGDPDGSFGFAGGHRHAYTRESWGISRRVSQDEVSFERIEAALKRVSAVLEGAGIPFLLAGSLAAWARGGPETRNDLDLMLRPDDAERALEALAAEGMATERPPEQWLLKAWDEDVMVDLIFEILAISDESGVTERHPVDDELFGRAEDLKVFGVLIRVMSLEDLMVTKLLALEPNALDYGGSLSIARSLREEIDWDRVRERTAESPYATAFFSLVEELGVVERDPA